MALSKKDKLRLLTILLESRHGDLREESLNRQGKGHFHVAGMGHEALAAISLRDRAGRLHLRLLSRPRARPRPRRHHGASWRSIILPSAKVKATAGRCRRTTATPNTTSGASPPRPDRNCCRPAAWPGASSSTGSRTWLWQRSATPPRGRAIFTRRFASPKEKQLPMLFLVEDNGYGISSPTRKINPLAIDVLQPNDWREFDGSDVDAVHEAGQEAIAHLRAGKGPVFFWVKMERLSSHTSSDDHKLYRSAEELENLAKADPLTNWKDRLIADGVITRGGLREARPGNQGADSPGIHRCGARSGSVGRRAGDRSDRQAAAAR